MNELRRRCYTCKCLEWESSIRFFNRTKDNAKSKFYCKKCDPVRKARIAKTHEMIARKKELKKEVERFTDVCRIQVEELQEKNRIKNRKLRETEKSKIQRRRYWNSDKGKAYASINSYNRRVNNKNACKDLSYQEKLLIGRFYRKCPTGFEVDHIIPVSKGGKHQLSNLQYLTKDENRRKAARILTNQVKDETEKLYPLTHICEPIEENEITTIKRAKSCKYKKLRTLCTK